MDVIYAETINSFANDLDNLRKNNTKSDLLKISDNQLKKEVNNCSLKRFLLSAQTNLSEEAKLIQNPNVLSNVDRLAKTASIWTRPELSRIETENILQDFDKGIFIVRMTTNKKTIVLSYRGEDKVQHVMVKVDVTKGFYMDGSQNIFRNVNVMISHYMTHSIHGPDLFLKLPKALTEAFEPMHFKFFENLKLDFWKTSLANKSINEIWPAKPRKEINSTTSSHSDGTLPLPPRRYDVNDLSIIQGLADVTDTSSSIYNKIVKDKKKTPVSRLSKEEDSTSESERVYSNIWNWTSDHDLPEENENKKLQKTKKNEDLLYLREIIKKYYPHLIKLNMEMTDGKFVSPSLSEDILLIKAAKTSAARVSVIKTDTKLRTRDINNNETHDEKDVTDSVLYETPWDIQTPWITKLMEIDCNDEEKQSKFMSEMVKATSRLSKTMPPILPFATNSKSGEENIQRVQSLYSYTDDESDQSEAQEEKLKQELLVEIQQVLVLPSPDDVTNTPNNKQFGQAIRKHLIQLCSRKGSSDISNSVRMFVQCTIDRTDLSPYTTMRLIQQYMSGLKNLIKQQKKEFGLINVIEEERKKTPKNVFINLDSVMESVLTKAVLKPLTPYVYRLLVLEHYKNSSLKLISDGIEAAKKLSPEKLGLKESSIAIIESNLEMINKKFTMMAKTYSPEKKIGHLISIIEIIFQVVKLIYPDSVSESTKHDVKTDNLLPVLAYVFSKCKKDAIAAQCEVEYIEGLIWSSSLVDGEPGFYLMNFMSSLEVIKVLARPHLDSNNMLDLKDKETTKISNSEFFKRINHATVSDTATGSVNVIILDEKINRLITKTFPVRSTVNARTLCNSIAHRLGLFNPMEYNLYILNRIEDVVLDDFEFPLQIKQQYQHKTKETIQFLFKRKNATFILPTNVAT